MSLFRDIGIGTPIGGFHTYEPPKQIVGKGGEATAVQTGPSQAYHKSGLMRDRKRDIDEATKAAKKAGGMGIVNTGLRLGAKVVGSLTGTSAVLEPAVAALQYGMGMLADKKKGNLGTRERRDVAVGMMRGGAQESADQQAEASAMSNLAAEQKKTASKNKWLDPINKAMDVMDYANMAKSAMNVATTATAGAKDAMTGMREVSTPAKAAIKKVGAENLPGFRQVAKAGLDPASVGQAQLAADKAMWASKMQAPATGYYGGVEGGSMLQQGVKAAPEVGATTITPGYEGVMSGATDVGPVESGLKELAQPTIYEKGAKFVGAGTAPAGKMQESQQPYSEFQPLIPPGKKMLPEKMNHALMRNAMDYVTWGGRRGAEPDWGTSDLVRRLMSNIYRGQ